MIWPPVRVRTSRLRAARLSLSRGYRTTARPSALGPSLSAHRPPLISTAQINALVSESGHGILLMHSLSICQILAIYKSELSPYIKKNCQKKNFRRRWSFFRLLCYLKHRIFLVTPKQSNPPLRRKMINLINVIC